MNYIGKKYNSITVLSESAKNKHNKRTFLCRCDCGEEKVFVLSSLKSGNTKSCGCTKPKAISSARFKHGRNQTNKTYSTWRAMKERCKKRKCYIDKNITVCNEWATDFLVFLSDMGERPGGKTLDRKDNNKGYYKDNCRWATPQEQSKNTSRNRYLTMNGKTMLLIEWGEELNIAPSTIHGRLRKGWTIEEALSQIRRAN